MLQCAFCKVHACESGEKEKMPAGCPMHEEALEQEALSRYQREHNQFFVNAALVEAEGYGEWPRVREIMEFAGKMGYRHLGLAFCGGLKDEAYVCAKLLKDAGFQVSSVICKNGAFPKQLVGIRDDQQVRPGQTEMICNPIAQAKLLEQAGTEFNIVLGLCVGHDSLFFQYTHVPCTVLVAKDRAMGHNPVAALYPCNRYLQKRLMPEKKSGEQA